MVFPPIIYLVHLVDLFSQTLYVHCAFLNPLSQQNGHSMLTKNLSLILFVALVAAGCAPKTTRKPITPNDGKGGQAAGDQAGNGGKPEARETPQTQPSAT